MQKRAIARFRPNVTKKRVGLDSFKSAITLAIGALEPIQRLRALVSPRVNLRDLISIASCVLNNEAMQSSVGHGLVTERMVGHRYFLFLNRFEFYLVGNLRGRIVMTFK